MLQFIKENQNICGEEMNKKVILACTVCQHRNYTTNKKNINRTDRKVINMLKCDTHEKIKEEKDDL